MTEIEYLETIDSTNEELKRRVQKGLDTPLCLVSDEQTAGKGRKGRSFYSPGGSVGIYMSYLYFSSIPISDALSVTTAISVIVATAIEEITGEQAYIKWVNDIYVRGRKVSGILTELIPNGENNAIIVGIGINLSTKEFPKEILDRAGSIVEHNNSIIRKNIIEEITKGLDEYVKIQKLSPYIDEYRRRSCVIGKNIVYSDWNGEYAGKVVMINDNGNLLVKLNNGEKRLLDSGEISLKVTE